MGGAGETVLDSSAGPSLSRIYWRFGLIRLRRLGHELPSASSPPLPVEQRHWQGAPPTGPEIVSIGPRPDRNGKPAKLTLGPVDVSGVEQDGTPVLGAPLSTRSPRQH